MLGWIKRALFGGPSNSQSQIGDESGSHQETTAENVPGQDAGPASNDEPPGEAEMVIKVRTLCQLAQISARRFRDLDEADDEVQRHRQLYLERKQTAQHLIGQITDEFYREAALHSLINLCVAGDELDEAKQLLATVSEEMIVEKIIEDHPELGNG